MEYNLRNVLPELLDFFDVVLNHVPDLFIAFT